MYAIVPAAGSGTRMGTSCAGTSKVLLELGDAGTVLAQTLKSIVDSKVVEGIVVACLKSDFESVNSLLSRLAPKLECWCVVGGAERQESVYNALVSLEGKTEMVLIHDGARPLCPIKLIQMVAEKAKNEGAAILGVPSRSTLKTVVSNGSLVVKETVPRETVWEAQTPQVFSFTILKAAHERAIKDKYTGTDDSSLVERLGHVIQVVEGSTRNIKITTPEDLEHVQVLVSN